MPDGRTLAATDAADEIAPGADGRSLGARWRRFVRVGGKTGDWIDPGFEVSTEWRIDGSTLTRSETLTSRRDVTVRRLFLVLSSTATQHAQPPAAPGAAGVIQLTGPEGVLEARTAGDLSVAASIRTVGDEPLGRGPRVAIPTHVTFEARDIQLRAGQPRSWEISLTPSTPITRTTR
jgi:hypothetical protein